MSIIIVDGMVYHVPDEDAEPVSGRMLLAFFGLLAVSGGTMWAVLNYFWGI